MSFRNKPELRLLVAGLVGLLLLVNGCGSNQQPTVTPTQHSISADTKSQPHSSPVAPPVPAPKPPMVKPEPVVKVKPVQPLATKPSKPANVEQISITAVGENQTIFALESLPIQTDESVFAVTKRAAEKVGIKLTTEGFYVTAYIAGIGDLKEFDRGPTSGWLYRVNGQYPNIGAGMYKLKPGDRIEWIYSTGAKKLTQ
ncbi:MAG: DUF4430 domain-containing protein [Methylocystaceae bacterium]